MLLSHNLRVDRDYNLCQRFTLYIAPPQSYVRTPFCINYCCGRYALVSGQVLMFESAGQLQALNCMKLLQQLSGCSQSHNVLSVCLDLKHASVGTNTQSGQVKSKACLCQKTVMQVSGG